MAEILSAGVFVSEIDASTIAPTVSNSVGVFGGDFIKGPVGITTLITSVADLTSFYGTPTNFNFNDFYQAYNFLQYGNKLLVSRAANIVGTGTDTTLLAPAVAAVNTVVLGAGEGASFTVGDIIGFGPDAATALITQYTVAGIATDTLTLDRALTLVGGESIFKIDRSMNSVIEAAAVGGVTLTNDVQFGNLTVIENASDYEAKEISIPFSDATSKLKFTARSVGSWANGIEICIANSTAFNNATPSLAFPGIALDDLFEYAPTGTEYGIIIRENNIIVETFTVDSDPLAKDHNQKSTYVENVINTQSNYLFCKDNTAAAQVQDFCAEINGVPGTGSLVMIWGADSQVNNAALLDAYSIVDNKEEIDIDIVIGNERDYGASANALTSTRLDCIGFVGANYADTVGKKSAIATALLLDWRKATGTHAADGANINYDNMFMVACGNYKYQYDKVSVA